jgi:hypothetical protein
MNIDISDQLTEAFFANPSFKRGSVLVFGTGKDRKELKIVRLNRKKQICEVKETKLMTEQEMKDKFNQEARDAAVNQVQPVKEGVNV